MIRSPAVHGLNAIAEPLKGAADQDVVRHGEASEEDGGGVVLVAGEVLRVFVAPMIGPLFLDPEPLAFLGLEGFEFLLNLVVAGDIPVEVAGYENVDAVQMGGIGEGLAVCSPDINTSSSEFSGCGVPFFDSRNVILVSWVWRGAISCRRKSSSENESAAISSSR